MAVVARSADAIWTAQEDTNANTASIAIEFNGSTGTAYQIPYLLTVKVARYHGPWLPRGQAAATGPEGCH